MPNPVGTEGPKQPLVADIIALAEACHGHVVEALNNNHNHTMMAVESHHKKLINGLKRLQNKTNVHASTQTGDTKATTMTTGSQASSSKTTQATATTASDTSTRASQATTESGSQGPTSPHDSHLSQREHTDSSPDFEWDEEL